MELLSGKNAAPVALLHLKRHFDEINARPAAQRAEGLIKTPYLGVFQVSDKPALMK